MYVVLNFYQASISASIRKTWTKIVNFYSWLPPAHAQKINSIFYPMHIILYVLKYISTNLYKICFISGDFTADFRSRLRRRWRRNFVTLVVSKYTIQTFLPSMKTACWILGNILSFQDFSLYFLCNWICKLQRGHVTSWNNI